MGDKKEKESWGQRLSRETSFGQTWVAWVHGFRNRKQTQGPSQNGKSNRTSKPRLPKGFHLQGGGELWWAHAPKAQRPLCPHPPHTIHLKHCSHIVALTLVCSQNSHYLDGWKNLKLRISSDPRPPVSPGIWTANANPFWKNSLYLTLWKKCSFSVSLRKWVTHSWKSLNTQGPGREKIPQNQLCKKLSS